MARPIQLTTLLVGSALLAALVPLAHADGDADAVAAPPDLSACATIVGKPTPAAAAVAAQLLGNVEHDPLYAEFAPATGRPACKLRFQAGGALQIDYQFKGGALTIRNDPRLEYSEQRLRVKAPLRASPETLLADAEHFLYGEKGCRINWSDPETLHPSARSARTETVWHGDVCNCRAGVDKDATGQVTGVSFKSAC